VLRLRRYWRKWIENRLMEAGGSVPAKFSRRMWSPPPIIFARIVRPMNALQLCRWQFSYKKLCSRLSSSEVRFYTEMAVLRFWALPFRELRGNTYDVHLRLTGKRNFFARCYRWGAMSEYRPKFNDLAPRVSGADSKISGRSGGPHEIFFFWKNRLNDLSYGVKIWTERSSVLSQCTRLTDGQTYRVYNFLLTRPPCIQCSAVKSYLQHCLEWVCSYTLA